MNMKRTTVIVFCALVCLCGGKVMAQKNKAFTGSVKFAVKYEGDFEPQQLAKLPTESEWLISGNFKRTTRDLGGAFMHQIDMVDSVVQLWDLPMEKSAVSIPTPIKKDTNDGKKNYVINKRNDTKNICGYDCQGYDIVVTVKNDDEDEDEDDEDEEAEPKTDTITVYTTMEIGLDSNINCHFAPGLQGYPLYQEQPAGEGKKVISEAVEVKKKKINPIEFSIPSNYKYYTVEQWKAHVRELQGGGGEDDDDEDF